MSTQAASVTLFIEGHESQQAKNAGTRIAQ